MNPSTQVFHDQYLADGSANEINSRSVSTFGNKVVASITVTNISGGSVTFYIDGSYDGKAWDQLAASSAVSAFGHTPLSVASLSHAFVRMRAVAGTSAKAIFDGTLVFSQQ